ncbi:carboxymuconolactone decarboxylase family protein [Kitasatospora sp. NPDC059599]|uniref:carboxymuconolactone decarboxylase family protein n=1 Tax=Kitasatospora sp. NPDC059599 TaxID=3346880 RepID=UPI00368D96AF
MSTAANDAGTRAERFAHGMEVLDRIDGEVRRRVVESLDDISPEDSATTRMTLGTSNRTGYPDPEGPGLHPNQLVNASLNVGLTPEQIVEALLHSAAYCGFPKALHATFVAKKVFAERGLLPVTGT